MQARIFSLYAALKLILAYINELLKRHLEKKTWAMSLIKRGRFLDKTKREGQMRMKVEHNVFSLRRS